MKNMVRLGDPTPDFYRVEERDIDMPGDAQLIVELWDKDEPWGIASAVPALANPDQLIGSTFIDLEDRWYSKKWKKDMDKGAICKETRKLTNLEDPMLNNGTIEMWVEMLKTDEVSDKNPLSKFNRDLPVDIDVRVVIWEVREVRLVDGDHTDAQVVTKIECNNYGGEPLYPKRQLTDVHWNCQSTAEFNYRVVFTKIETPTSNCTLGFQLQDENKLAGSTHIGEVVIDITKHVMKVMKDGDAIRQQAQEVKFVDDSGEEDDESAVCGILKFELYVLQTGTVPVQGLAQLEPNDDPALMAPTNGRNLSDQFAAFAFDFSGFDTALLKKVLPVIIFSLLCLVLLRWLGLL
jgi:hypothetical protein